MKRKMKSTRSVLFVFSFLALFPSVLMANPPDVPRDEPRDANFANDRALDRLNSRGGFGAGAGGYVPDDWERDGSAGFLGEGDDEQSYKDSAERERQKIDKRYEDSEEEINRQRQVYLGDKQAYQEEVEREKRLAALNKQKLDYQRAESIRELERFKKNAGPPDKWTNDQKTQYDKLVQKSAELFQPTEEESEEIQRHQDVRDKVYNEIRTAAYQMGNLSPEEVQARIDRAETADAATRTWRDFTFTGKMVTEVQDDIVRQRERGIFANNMMMASDLYLKRGGITPEERGIAEQIRANNMAARGFAADAISKDMAVIGLGTAADVGMIGVGRAVSKAVGAVGNYIRGGGGGTPPPGGTPSGGGGAGTAGSEAGQAGGAAGTKPVSSATQDAIDAGKAAVGKYGSLDQAADELIGGADDIVMPAEAAAANAEVDAIKASVSKLSPAEVEKLLAKTSNLTPAEIIQKAEILAQREALKQAILRGAVEDAAAAQSGAASGGTTQPFGGVLPVPGQGAGPATGGATQKFGGVLPLPGQAGGTTQQFGGVLPIPGQGAGQATSGATQSFGGVLPIPGQAAGSATQGFKGVLPLPGGGVSGASEAPTVVG